MFINRWLVFFLILPHLNIYYLGLDQIQPITYIWQFAVVFLGLIILYKKKTINIFLLLLLFHVLIILTSSLIHGNLTFGIIFKFITLLGLCIYISNAVNNFKEFITGLYYLMAMLILFNLLTMVMQGIDFDTTVKPIYLLGGKNAIAISILPAIPIVYMYSYAIYKKLKFLPIIIILCSIVSVYLSGSSTGFIISLLTITFMFLPKRIFASFKVFLNIYLLTFFIVVILRLQEVLFGNFIINVLNKDLTFTGRTYIWDLVLEKIKSSWILGYGRGNSIINDLFPNINETHNGILEILMDSGLIGILLFTSIVFIVGRKLSENSNHIYPRILSFSIFAYMVIGLTESVFNKTEFWILLVIGFGINNIISQGNFKSTKEVNS
jgi:O-antigen ligase